MRLLGAITVPIRQWGAPTNVAGVPTYVAISPDTSATMSIQGIDGDSRRLLREEVRTRSARWFGGNGSPPVHVEQDATPGDAAGVPASRIQIDGDWYLVEKVEPMPAHRGTGPTYEGLAVRAEPGEITP